MGLQPTSTEINTATGVENVLEAFAIRGESYSGLTVVSGNAYEVLPYGGSGAGERLDVNLKTGRQHVLYTFTGGVDGSYPVGPLVYHDGAFYGATAIGANGGCSEGCGTIFKYVQ